DDAATLRAGVELVADERQTGNAQRARMIFVGALQRLIQKRANVEGDVRRAFALAYLARLISRYATIEDLTTVAGHDYAIALGRNDCIDDRARSFLDQIELAIPHPCRAVVCGDPQGAGVIGLQHEHTTSWQPVSIDCIRAAAVVTSKSAIGRKPRHAEFRLRDRVRAIGRQSMKRSYRAPLMQVRRRCR